MTRMAPLLLLIPLGCGPGVPAHEGYPRQADEPWADPEVLELDDLGEAEVDDTVSYPKRERARWYAVDLPSYGELEVKLRYGPLLFGQEAQELDLAFEVLNEDFKVITRADAAEPDAGDEKKSRTLYELQPGRYYIHVYAQERTDEAEFTLRLSQEGKGGDGPSDFPAGVAFLDALPAVPPVDDAPPPRRKPKPRPRPRPRPDRDKDKDEKPEAIRGRIAGISASGAGTRIKINRGTNAGVEVGWRGAVITGGGQAIPKGRFSISRVTPGESYAKVKATADAVTSAKYVRLRPPPE